MGYMPPRVSAAGLSIPAYLDILDDNIQQFKNIYGSNEYVGEDSAIYQLLSILSLKQSDDCQGLQLAYNNQSPATAVGAGLDRIVKINGIARKSYSYSTATLTITGVSGTVISNGQAQDTNGNTWVLPSSVTIPGSGTTSVVATCAIPGAITAEPGTINIVATPQGGWTSVTNPNAAVPGVPVETDSQLRARQSISTSLPSKSLFSGLIAAIASVAGVTRYNVLENYTSVVDAYGNPPHSVSAVVEGGTDADVAQAIYNDRGVGVYPNGTTSVTITDAVTGLATVIRFFRPTYIPIYVIVNVHLLPGSTSNTLNDIQTDVVNYLNDLNIGESVVWSELFAAALNARPNPDMPIFSIRSIYSGIAPSPTGTSDISLLFNEVSQGITANVIVNSI